MSNSIFSFLFFLILFLGQDTFAQTQISDALLDTISTETCQCLDEKIPEKETSSEKLELNIGLCLMQVCSDHQDEFSEIGISLENTQSFELLSEKIGEHMANSCDKFLEILFVLMNDKDSNVHLQAGTETEKTNSVAKLESMTGRVNKTEQGLLLRLWVGHDNGVDVFICLDSFEGIELVKNLDKLKGQKVQITYEKIEVYSPSEKRMIEMKKLASIVIAK